MLNIKRSLSVLFLAGAAFAGSLAPAAASADGWTYEGRYPSYTDCRDAAVRLDAKYGINDWDCIVVSPRDSRYDLFILW